MSRVGKHPINIPKDVEVSLANGILTGKSKNGQFRCEINTSVVSVEISDSKVFFGALSDDKFSRSMWGSYRAIVFNSIRGLCSHFEKKLNLVGVGYKASVQGANLVMQLGYSHDIIFPIPAGVKIVCEAPTVIVVSGSDKQIVGEVVKQLQKFRSPEPYKGKGIIIEGQYVHRKEGKKK
ncbi:MAG: 50S ribosomal protein L6 [Holosporaceae bacterium]|jgi:large subunit ribosomal protein L6|nr:50S ribosomal protein L6 [Holosporaceae bacterium]